MTQPNLLANKDDVFPCCVPVPGIRSNPSVTCWAAHFMLHFHIPEILCSYDRQWRSGSMTSVRVSRSLPLQVAAICYRRRGASVEFLLVKTNGGSKWTFPKGATEARLSHSQAAEREALEEAGARGVIEPRRFHLYLHSKGVFWQPGG